MPVAAPHPCAQPGCRALVPRGTYKCTEHTKATRKAEDARRGSAHSRGYDRTWQRVRAAFIADHPFCVQCEADGDKVIASVVDHIVTIKDRPELRLEPSNLRSLCKRHHDQRTARDQAWGRGG